MVNPTPTLRDSKQRGRHPHQSAIGTSLAHTRGPSLNPANFTCKTTNRRFGILAVAAKNIAYVSIDFRIVRVVYVITEKELFRSSAPSPRFLRGHIMRLSTIPVPRRRLSFRDYFRGSDGICLLFYVSARLGHKNVRRLRIAACAI